MGADNFVNSLVAGKRGARRSRVLLAALIETPFGTFEARLRDLSRLGALVECVTDLERGSEVLFVRGQTRVPARVAWSVNGRIGLEFQFPIDEQEVLVQLTRKTGRKEGLTFTLPAPTQDMSARERKVAQAWSATVGLSVPEADS